MNCRHVPVGVDYVQAVEFGVFVLDAVFLEVFLHVEWTAQTLPDVTGPMFVELRYLLRIYRMVYSDGLQGWCSDR